MRSILSKPQRQSLRLPGYDYRQAGVYYVTIVTWQRECLFGEIVDERMCLNPIGQMIQNEWQRLCQRFYNLALDEFSVMPNHMHGMIEITHNRLQKDASIDSAKQPARPSVDPGSLAAIIRAYKSSTTLRFNRTRWATGKPLWQRNYYDHIVRDDDELNRVRQYIQDNPVNWTIDEENQP